MAGRYALFSLHAVCRGADRQPVGLICIAVGGQYTMNTVAVFLIFPKPMLTRWHEKNTLQIILVPGSQYCTCPQAGFCTQAWKRKCSDSPAGTNTDLSASCFQTETNPVPNMQTFLYITEIYTPECMSFEEGNKAWSCHITQDYFSGVCRGIWFRLQLHAKKQLPTRPLLLETQCIRHVEVDVFIIIPVLIFPESCFWHVLSIQ